MERNYSIDYFKFWAIFFVVCIHTRPFSGGTLIGIDGEYLNYIINTFARFGVPFFFIVSGYLFGQKLISSINSKKHFKNYFIKISKLFINWYLFYIIFGLVLKIINAIVKNLSLKQEALNYLNSFIGIKEIILFIIYGGSGGPASYHLWYLSALIWSILTIYIFIKINKMNVLLIISFILNLVGLLGQTYAGIFNLELLNFNIQTRDALFFGLFYTTLGCYIAYNFNWIKQKLDILKSSVLVIFFIIFSLTQIVERTIAHIFWKEQIRAEDFYLSTIFLTLSLFLLVIKNGHIGKNSLISKVGKNAVGIYVSHTLFIHLTFLIFDLLEINIRELFVFHVVFTPLVFFISYYYYNLLQKIKQKLRLFFSNEKKLLEKKITSIN